VRKVVPKTDKKSKISRETERNVLFKSITRQTKSVCSQNSLRNGKILYKVKM
jgi:hypothetical protein